MVTAGAGQEKPNTEPSLLFGVTQAPEPGGALGSPPAPFSAVGGAGLSAQKHQPTAHTQHGEHRQAWRPHPHAIAPVQPAVADNWEGTQGLQPLCPFPTSFSLQASVSGSHTFAAHVAVVPSLSSPPTLVFDSPSSTGPCQLIFRFFPP